MENEDSVRAKLLETNKSESEGTMDKATIENEKEGLKSAEDFERDLRLHDAVYDPENIEEIETLVSEEPKLVFERDAENKTPLHTLVLAGDEQAPEIAKILLGVTETDDDSSLISIERPEVLNLQDSHNSTALHYAARGRQPELVASLLRWGSNATIQDGHGNNALHLAAEGNTEKALEVAKTLLANDAKRALINCMNNNEHSPLHVAVSKKAVKMVNFLLEPKNKCDLSLKNGLGGTALHFACSEIGENENSCEVVKALLKRCSKAQLNQADNRGRTPLHLAAIKRLPKITKILVEDERTDVVKTDEKGRTALHYATEDGCYTKGYQCVEVLITRKFPKYGEQVNYMFKMEDNLSNTPFMYATLNCPAGTMKMYTDTCPKPQYWLTSMYMTLMYKNSPLALTPLMDKAFSEDENDTREGEDAILTDFGVITGYVDPVDILPQQETKYLKESLWWDYPTRQEILLHPLVQLFVMKKWQKLKFIIAFCIFWQFVWLAAYTSLSVTFYSTPPEMDNRTASATEMTTFSSNGSKLATYLGSFVMLIYLVGSIMNETFEMCTIGSAYVLSLTNILQLIQCILGFIAISPVFLGYSSPETWMKYTTATGVLLAYILGMRDVGKLHKEIGLIVEVLKQVLIQIVTVLACCSPLWIGFTIAFYIIFSDQESLNSAFPGPIVKVLVMMTGEFEYNDTFKNEDESGVAKFVSPGYVKIARLSFFLAFLIAVPVGFFNLLTGFALDKVMELRERAKVARISKQLEHIYFIESILLSFRPLRKIFSHSAVVSFLRKLNVTSKLFNTEVGPELKFETFIKETIRQSNRNIRRGGGFNTKLQNTVAFCRSELPKEVFERIYFLASPKSKSQDANN